MSEQDPKVLDEPKGAGVPQGTPSPEGVTEQKPVTPVQSSSDAEATLKAQYELELKKREEDLRKMKSTFQSQDAQRQKDWQQRQKQYESEIEKLRVSRMNDDERKVYEREKESQRVQELEQALTMLERQNQETQAKLVAQQYFLEKGVPASVLITTEDYDTLYNSGMEWIMNEFEKLKTSPQSRVIPPTVPPSAPPVDTGTGTPPSGPSWTELIAKHGSRERVYQLIEERRLSPDILPKFG